MPTYEEILLEKGCYVSITKTLILPDEKLVNAFEALAKLIWLRDYYNEGWQPDWKKEREMKYVIYNDSNRLATIQSYNTSYILAFKEGNVRNKFLEEQKELLKSVLTDISNIRKETKLLEARIAEVKKEENLEKQTDMAKEFLVEGLENLRVPCDNLEKIVDNEIWTLPTYTDLLFKL